MTSMNRIGFIGNTNQLNTELVTVRPLAAQDAAIKKKKAKQKSLIYMCVFFKATICSMFLQICFYDIVKIKLVF